MTRPNLLLRQLADRRAAMIAWAAGLSAYVVLIVSIWPTVRDSSSFADVADEYPDVLKEFFGGQAAFDFTTAAGFVNAEMYAIVLPVLLVVVAIGLGASLGADQSSGLMDMILANPVSRRRVVTERAAAAVVWMGALSVAIGVTLLIAGMVVDLDFSLANVAAATAMSALLALVHGLLALTVAAATGGRGAAVGAATVAFALGYIVSGLGGLVDWIEPLRPLAPYHWATRDNALSAGWDLGATAVLMVLCTLLVLSAIELFERRDLT